MRKVLFVRRVIADFSDKYMAKSVCAKINDNVRSALRIMLSEAKPADDNDATFNQFIERYPSASTNRKAYA